MEAPGLYKLLQHNIYFAAGPGILAVTGRSRQAACAVTSPSSMSFARRM